MIVLKSTQDKVLAALQSVAGIVERRHTLPILANVLLRKTGSQVQLTTSDLEIQIRTTAELDGDSGNFATTLGARKLIDILRTMPGDQTVSLESSAGKLILKGGKSRFTLQSMPAEDFPLVQESASFGPVFSVPQKTLKNLLGQVSFAQKLRACETASSSSLRESASPNAGIRRLKARTGPPAWPTATPSAAGSLVAKLQSLKSGGTSGYSNASAGVPRPSLP